MVLSGLNRYARVECGFASISDVIKKTRENRMESFFLSETLKYLYLLFDEGEDSDSIFIFVWADTS